MKQLIILGAGAAGTMMANKLASVLPADDWQITILDRDAAHIYQPGLLFLPFRMYREEELVKPRARFIPEGVTLRLEEPERVDAEANEVVMPGGERLAYDLLIVATGTRIAPEETPGMTGAGWQETIFDFYTLEGARALAEKLDTWEGGRMVVNIADMPIKCPVAPLEFVFLADAYFRKRGMRDRVEIVYSTPLDGAFTKPRAAATLGALLEDRNILQETNFQLDTVDGEAGTISSYDGRTSRFDLLVTVPLHRGSELIARSGLGDMDGFVPTDKHTLQSVAHPNIFAIGDATDLPTSKAGSVAHFQAEVLVENIEHFLHDRPLSPAFDGHANCFIETGDDRAILIDFNYETEPLPGRFPLPGIGPFTLLEESHVNHWGKLGFKWVYWNLLLTGQELPLDHRMLMAGKWS